MIVVAPAKAELILSALLDLGGAIPGFPVGALGGKEKLARKIAADEVDALVEDFVGVAKAFGVVGEKATAGLPEFFGFDDRSELIEIKRGRDETAVGVTFNGFELGAVFFRNDRATIAGEWFAFDLTR